jgi:uncharacterized repeat protein (TIGR01451 family)
MKMMIRLATVLALGAATVMIGCEACAVPTKPEPAPQPKPQAPCPPAAGTASASRTYPCGDKDECAVFVEKKGPNQVVAGQEFSYQVKVSNHTDMPFSNVVVEEAVPVGMKVSGTSPKTNQSGQTVTWAVGELKPKQAKTLTIQGTAADSGTLISCTRVKWDPPAVCLTMNAIQPALEVTKSGPDQVLQCDPITYKVTVKNTGDGTACDVVVRDDLPDGLKTADGRTDIVERLGNLAAGQSRQLTWSIRANKTGEFTNMATASSGAIKAQSKEVATTVVKPVLKVTKTGPDKRFVGRPAEFTITVENTGDGVAKNTTLTDRMGSGMTFRSASDGGRASGGQVMWSLGDLKPGAKKQVTVTVFANTKGEIRNVATAKAYCAEAASAEAMVNVAGKAAILLECVDQHDPIEVGANETYTITVTNQGSAVGTGIVIECTLPAEQDFVSAQGPTKETVQGKKVTFAPVKSLAPKKQVVYRVVVKGTKAGEILFKTTLKSDQMKRQAMETESTHIYED